MRSQNNNDKGIDRDDVLTAAEARMVRRGEKQLKDGRYKVWSEVKLKWRKRARS
jgi:hypothetical protein